MNGETNNIFQNWANQNQDTINNNYSFMGYNSPNLKQPQIPTTCGGGFVNGPSGPRFYNIPVRVVFSPEQIAPQEIPTNGAPALFPLSDGSKIIARSLSGNGLFEERIYVLQPSKNELETNQNQVSEFDQVMERLSSIEGSLNQVLNDLYGSKPTTNQEGDVINEQSI